METINSGQLPMYEDLLKQSADKFNEAISVIQWMNSNGVEVDFLPQLKKLNGFNGKSKSFYIYFSKLKTVYFSRHCIYLKDGTIIFPNLNIDIQDNKCNLDNFVTFEDIIKKYNIKWEDILYVMVYVKEFKLNENKYEVIHSDFVCFCRKNIE
jgi:hypothetical protein